MKKKKMRLGEILMESLEEVREHQAGRKKLRTTVRFLAEPAPIFRARQIKELREKLKLTQYEFASVLNVAVGTVRSWEQGIRKPEKVCNRLLQILNENPKIIKTFKTA